MYRLYHHTNHAIRNRSIDESMIKYIRLRCCSRNYYYCVKPSQTQIYKNLSKPSRSVVSSSSIHTSLQTYCKCCNKTLDRCCGHRVKNQIDISSSSYTIRWNSSSSSSTIIQPPIMNVSSSTPTPTTTTTTTTLASTSTRPSQQSSIDKNTDSNNIVQSQEKKDDTSSSSKTDLSESTDTTAATTATTTSGPISMRDKIRDRIHDTRTAAAAQIKEFRDHPAQSAAEGAKTFSGMLRKYGPVFVGTYGCVYFTTLGLLFSGVQSGVLDPLALFSYLGQNPTTHGAETATTVHLVVDWMEHHDITKPYASYVEKNPAFANLAVAWIAVKFTEPIRLPIALGLTPRVSQFLGYTKQDPSPVNTTTPSSTDTSADTTTTTTDTTTTDTTTNKNGKDVTP